MLRRDIHRLQGEILWREHLAGFQYHSSFDGVLQFPHVPRPGIGGQHLHRLGRDPDPRLLRLTAVFLEEELGKLGDFLRPFPQRGHRKRDHVEPEEEVLPEGPGFDGLQEIPIGRRNHPDVHLDRTRAAHAIELPVLEKPQELGLKPWLHVADLVQEDCPAVGDLELAAFLAGRPGEGALLMAKQLRFQELLRQGHTVHGHEQAASTGAPVVNRPGKEVLACSTLAEEKDCRVALRHFLGALNDRIHLGAGGHERIEPALQFGPKGRYLALECSPLQRFADHEVEIFVVERFRDEIGGAFLHRLDRPLDGAIGGHHDHGQLRQILVHPPEDLHPVAFRQLDVEEHQAWHGVLKGIQSSLSVTDRHDVVPHRLQSVAQHGGDVGVVFHDQDQRPHRHNTLPPRPIDPLQDDGNGCPGRVLYPME